MGIIWGVFTPEFARADSGFSGMYLQGVNPRIAAAMGLNTAKGVLIRDIASGEPAALAGLERGDLIVRYAGQAIDSFKTLVKVAGKTRPGQEIEVGVLRGGQEKTFKLKLASRPAAWSVVRGEIVTMPEVGLTLAALTPKIRKRFNLRWGALGVLVTLIDPDHINTMPMVRGDVIVQIDQKDVWSPKQVAAAYRRAQKEKRKSLLMLIERMGEFQFMLLPVKETK